MASIKKSEFAIIRRPRITEKGALAGANSNCVIFEVHPDANKIEIRGAVEKIFGVTVVKVRTQNSMGKIRRIRMQQGRARNWKKAYVTLAKGNTIDVIEGL